MSEQWLRTLTWSAAAAVLASAAFAGMWGLPSALGVVAGGVWNLTSLWCLVHLLNAWLVPLPVASAEGGSAPRRRPWWRRQGVGWLLVKFPLLYAIAVIVLRVPAVSIVGFGIGFTVVLLVMAVTLALRARHLATPSHGE